MDRSEVIYLLTPTHAKDAYGQYLQTYARRQVFCDVSSVTQTEWFEGARNGLNPSLRFTMFGPDYNGERMLEYQGTVYTIYRTYTTRNEIIELYCELNEKDFNLNG